MSEVHRAAPSPQQVLREHQLVGLSGGTPAGAGGLSPLCFCLPPLPEGGLRTARKLFSAEEFHSPGGTGTEAQTTMVSGIPGFLYLCPRPAPPPGSSCLAGLGQGDSGTSPRPGGQDLNSNPCRRSDSPEPPPPSSSFGKTY